MKFHLITRQGILQTAIAVVWITVPVLATERMIYPLGHALMQADAVAVVEPVSRRAKSMHSEQVTFKVIRWLHGKTNVRTVLNGPNDFEVGTGKPYIFAIGHNFTMVIASWAYSEKFEREVLSWYDHRAPWSAPVEGLSVTLSPSAFRITDVEHLDLFFGIKNVSHSTRSITYSNLPLGALTHWELDIKDASGQKITSQPHPHLDSKSFQEFEQTQGRTYTIVLAPGDSHVFGLPRVNSAQPGWGYKEELNFRYYAMPPGRYRIRARMIGFTDIPVLVSKPLEVEVVGPAEGKMAPSIVSELDDSKEIVFRCDQGATQGTIRIYRSTGTAEINAWIVPLKLYPSKTGRDYRGRDVWFHMNDDAAWLETFSRIDCVRTQ